MSWKLVIPSIVLMALLIIVPSSSDGAVEYLSPEPAEQSFTYDVGESVTWRMVGNGFTFGYRIASMTGAPSWLTLHSAHATDEDYISGTAVGGSWSGVRVNWIKLDAYGAQLDAGTITIGIEVPITGNVFTLDYYMNGGYDGPSDYTFVHEASTVTVPVSDTVPIRTLNRFVSWNTERDGRGTDYSPGDGIVLSAGVPVTLYAQWEGLERVVIDVPSVISSDSTSLLTDGEFTVPYSAERGILWSMVPQGSSVDRDTVSSGSGWTFMPHIGRMSELVQWLIDEGYYTGYDSIVVYLNGTAVTWSYDWSRDVQYGPLTLYYTSTYIPNEAHSVLISQTMDLHSQTEYWSATVRDADGNRIGSSGDVDGLWMVWGSNDLGNWPQNNAYVLGKGNYTLPSAPTLVSEGTSPPVTENRIDVDGESVERVAGVPYVYSSDGYHIWSAIPIGTTVGAETTVSDGPSGWVFMPFVSPLEDLYGSIVDGLSASVKAALDEDGGTITVGLAGPLIVKHARWHHSGNFIVEQGLNVYRGSYYLLEYGRDESAYATIDYPTGLTKVYSASDTLVSTGMMAEFDVVWGSDDHGNMPNTFLSHDRGNATFTPFIRLTVAERDTVHYMDPTLGVTVTATEGAQWSNGYDTASMTVAFRCVRDAQERVFWGWDGGDLTLDMKTVNGTTRFTVTVGDTVSTYNLGMWRAFETTIDLGSGTLTVKPIVKSSWLSFMDYETLDHPVTLAMFEGSNGPFTSVIFYRIGGADSYTQSVVSTKVLLDTYGIVLYDASLDVSLYWPEMTDKRLNFYSFSIYGTSVTINGMTYPVDPNTATITIGDTVKTFTNVYLTYPAVTMEESTQTHVVLTFVDDGTVIDLGPLTTYRIEFGGMWYFQTGLWEGHPATRTVWTWDPWTIDVDAKQLIFMFDGILALVTMGAGALMRDQLTLLDGLVIVSAFALSLSIIGVW